jgi:hypothetical protein
MIILRRSVLLAMLFCLPASVWAQSGANTGQIIGQVLDPSQAAVAGAEVLVRNKDTNFQRTAITDGTGRYAVTLLPLGPYAVSVNASGFQPATQDVTVTLGATISGNFEVSVQPVTENVSVTMQELTIEPTRSAPKSVLTDVQIHNLPSNGRRIQNMVTQTPATLIEPECSGFSVSGQKGIYANVSIDGGDYNSTWSCGVRSRSSSAPSFGFEGLQEIQVVRNNFSSEFGRSTGGVIAMSTRSGTNQFHGTSYYLYRDGNLAWADAFNRSPLARIQQVGGSIGGPIRKDRTFFFIAPEFQKGSKNIGVVYAMDAASRASAAGQALLSVAPEEDINAVSNGDSIITRLDHRISDTNSFFGRFDFTRTVAINSPGATSLQTGLGVASTTTSAKSNQLIQPANNYTAFGQLTSALSSRHLNELRFQFAREVRPRTYQGQGPQVTITNVGVYGPPSSGSWGNVGFQSDDNKYQLTDNFAIVSGAHTAKFGVDLLRAKAHALYNQQFNGAYTFSNLTNFANRTPASYVQYAGNGDVRLSITQAGFYLQDDWRILPGLTISPGFRYDAQWNPDYANPTVPQNKFPLASSIPDDKRMFAPRFGFAWDVGRDGKTVVRGGAGFFYAPTYMSIFAQSILFNGGNPEKAFSISINNPAQLASAFQSVGTNLATAPLNYLPVFTTPQAYQLFGAQVSDSVTNLAPFYFDPKFRNPRSEQFQFGLERQVVRSVSANVTYAQLNTLRSARQRDVNSSGFTTDATGRHIYSTSNRPFGPKFGKVQVTEAAGRSFYRGVTTALNVRRTRYTVDLYYTRSWNYTYDDNERGFTGIPYADVYDFESEYNYSNIDEPHVFLANIVYSLPFGFDVASSSKFTSGRPFSARTGGDSNLDGIVNDRPVENGVMFKRNSFRNNGFSDTSLRVQKNFVLPNERGKLSFSAEVFNLFNFNNLMFGSGQMVYGGGTIISNGTLVPQNPTTNPISAAANFMKLKDSTGSYVSGTTAGDSRTVQLGLRFQF